MRDSRRTRLVLVVLLLVSLTLIALNGSSGPGHAIRSGASAVFGPVQRAAASAFRPIHDFFGGIGKDQQAQLNRLKQENDLLRLQERASQYATCRAGELNALMHVAGIGQYTIKPAQVIAVGPAQSFAWTAEIDSGAQDGLKVGMTVINGDGLVGKVEFVSTSTSVVLLAIDPEFKVGVRVESTLEVGAVSGEGTDPMTVQLLTGQDLKQADRLVTDFRPDSLFAGGVPVGTLTSVHGTVGSLGRSASVQAYVNFTALDLVGVIVDNPRTDPRDSVLPPKPTITPGVVATPPDSSCGSPAIAASTATPTSTATPSTSTSP
jgi:rod shape-determining protein MreC